MLLGDGERGFVMTEFTKVRKGYRPEEVEQELSRLKQKIAEQEEELAVYNKREEELQRTQKVNNLEKEKLLAEKELSIRNEFQEKLRQLEMENAVLKAKIELKDSRKS